MDVHKLVDIMSTDLLFVEPLTPLNKITQLMSQQKHSCLLVVKNKKPLGIITERDIVSFFSKKLNDDMVSDKFNVLPLAEELMTHNLIMLHEDQNILDALVVSTANNVRHIPIINNSGDLTGIVTYTDIANTQRSIMESYSALIDRTVSERTSELEEANKLLNEMTLLDPLLGIGNRRAMEIDIKSTHDISERYEENYAIAMIDVDHFKPYNDFYGHQEGDEALQKITQSLKSTIRTTDRIYRYGGEEFLVLMPNTSLEGARELAQRMIGGLESEKIPHCKSPHNVITASCGLSIYTNEDNINETKWADIVKSADEALYAAKNAGRNQVSVHTA